MCHRGAMAPEKKKLIFLTSADPRSEPETIRRAYLWATRAAKEGLVAEVRLVGEAVRIARPEEIADFPRLAELRNQMDAGAGHAFQVSL